MTALYGMSRELVAGSMVSSCALIGPADNCESRKPKPGLFFQAWQVLNIDLNQSWTLGDTFNDVGAAQTAGVGQNALIRTGRGAQESQHAYVDSSWSWPIYDALFDALKSTAKLFTTK